MSSFLAFAGIDLRKPGCDPDILATVIRKQHECLARAALEIFKISPIEWWRLCREDYNEQLDQISGDNGASLLADHTLHQFVTHFRQWMAANLSKEQQDAFYQWFAEQNAPK